MPALDKIKLYILIFSGAVSTNQAMAQSKSWDDYNFVKESNAWLTSQNAAGLHGLALDNISQAELNIEKNNGDFRNYNQSDDSFHAGANIESLYRFNPKTVFFGGVKYGVSQGKNMAGSVFMNPDRLPFNIVEYSDENAGTKKLEIYNLFGAVSYELTNRLALGARIDFLASNYAKDKDLRHKNNSSDLSLTAGASYQINKLLEVGANYYYRRRIEGLEFKIYGKEGINYFALVDYGVFAGENVQYNTAGTYTTEDFISGTIDRPLVDQYHGIDVQLGFNFTSNLNLYNELSYRSREGQYGKRATSSIVYSEHDGDIWSYRGKLNFRNQKDLHSLDFRLIQEELDNQKNIFKIEKLPGQFTQRVIYYDPIKVGKKQFYNLAVAYTANLGIENNNPTWTVVAGFDFYNRQQISYFYPYSTKQSLDQSKVSISGKRNIVRGLNMYTVGLGIDYLWGNGTVKIQEQFANPEGEFQEPSVNSDYLNREYEYLTASRVKADVGFKYSRLFPKVGMKGYVSLDYSLTKAQNIKYLSGDSFNTLNLTIGCTF